MITSRIMLNGASVESEILAIVAAVTTKAYTTKLLRATLYSCSRKYTDMAYVVRLLAQRSSIQ